jgi:hypothetical protein
VEGGGAGDPCLDVDEGSSLQRMVTRMEGTVAGSKEAKNHEPAVLLQSTAMVKVHGSTQLHKLACAVDS